MSEIRFFEVGGCVRDEILGIPTKDVDFSVEAPSFDAMRDHLIAEGFRIFVENPEFVTIRASVPEGNPLRKRTKDADFVLCRKDGPTSDGRHPDFVEPGTLMDDLARRDFTMNAIARDGLGILIDPFGGRKDIAARRIRFVGNPMDRIEEDGLRVLRALRFSITKGFTFHIDTFRALERRDAAEMLAGVSAERKREELHKMFAADTIGSMDLLSHKFPDVMDACFGDGRIKLMPTMKEI